VVDWQNASQRPAVLSVLAGCEWALGTRPLLQDAMEALACFVLCDADGPAGLARFGLRVIGFMMRPLAAADIYELT
jgi:hypothetical protein